ncbi:MAG: 5'-methylthioadenosine/adenosylhomocysteine nucleosidase [Candidatus Zixiibacteriota bacterium]
MIGLMGAMTEEVALFRQEMEVRRTDCFAGMDFVVGEICDQQVVLLQSGIGKVKATMGTQIMIDRFDVDLIIFTGLAGALMPNMSRGDIVVSNNVVQYDFDLTAFGRRFGELPDVGRMIEVDSDLVKFACYAWDDVFGASGDGPHLFVGTICSGDRFVTDPRKIGWLQREFGAIATEMEGAAFGYTCHLNGVRFLIIRTISDTGGEQAADEFNDYLEVASRNSFKMVQTMLQVVSYRDDACRTETHQPG